MGYGVEQKYAGFRTAVDRIRLFLILAICTAVAAMYMWVYWVSISGEGRALFGTYVRVSWLAAQSIDEPIEITIDGEKYRQRPSAFRDAMQEEVYDGRSLHDLFEGGLWPSAICGLATFAFLCSRGWKRQPDDGEKILRGPKKYGRQTLQRRMILQAALKRGRPGASLLTRLAGFSPRELRAEAKEEGRP